MALSVKDGNGTLTTLKTTLTGSDHMPHHVVQAVSGTVQVTSSATSPVYVTGTVQVSQPISVDVVVGDNIFVTSSITSPLYISSSANSPVSVTGSLLVALNNNSVTASLTNPVAITGTVSVNNEIRVTSSYTNPLIIENKKTIIDADRTVFNVYNGIDYNNASSGTFEISNRDLTRNSLIVFNYSPNPLYITVGSSSEGPNGFLLSNTSSMPNKFSFVLFPSGTYIADSAVVSEFHGGFVPSGSGDFVNVYVTRIN